MLFKKSPFAFQVHFYKEDRKSLAGLKFKKPTEHFLKVYSRLYSRPSTSSPLPLCFHRASFKLQTGDKRRENIFHTNNLIEILASYTWSSLSHSLALSLSLSL